MSLSSILGRLATFLTPDGSGNVTLYQTPTTNDNSNKLSTTAFVQNMIVPFTGKNRIINGDCRMQQRTAASISGSATSGRVYGAVDRFFTVCDNTPGGAMSLSAGTMGITGGYTRNCVVLTATTAITSLTTTNAWEGIAQGIEGLNSTDLLGQQLAVSFWFNALVSGTYSVSLSDSTGSYTYTTSFSFAAGNTPQKITLSVPALPTAANIPYTTGLGLQIRIGALNTGTYQCPTASLGAWQAANYISAQGATNWAGTINNWIAVTELQLEAGGVVTTFERRPFGLEQLLCYRYYVRIGNTGSTVSSGVASGTATATAFGITVPATMRTTPTMNHNLTDANYAGNATPTGSQWTFVYIGSTFIAKSSGTIGITAGQSQVSPYLWVATGMSLAAVPNGFVLGPTAYMELTAEF